RLKPPVRRLHHVLPDDGCAADSHHTLASVRADTLHAHGICDEQHDPDGSGDVGKPYIARHNSLVKATAVPLAVELVPHRPFGEPRTRTVAPADTTNTMHGHLRRDRMTMHEGRARRDREGRHAAAAHDHARVTTRRVTTAATGERTSHRAPTARLEID